MNRCPSCGGIIGRDCFNPSECAWITEQQNRQHDRDHYKEGYDHGYAKSEPAEKDARIQQLEERVKELEELCQLAYIAGGNDEKQKVPPGGWQRFKDENNL